MARQPSEETGEQISNLPPRRQRLGISDIMNKESQSVGTSPAWGAIGPRCGNHGHHLSAQA